MKKMFFSIFSLWRKYKVPLYLNLTVILVLLLTFNLSAAGFGEGKSNPIDNPQQVTVRGTVTDASTGEALPGVNVVIPGSTVGTMTDASGKYSLEVPNASVRLQFSFIGYVTQEAVLGGQSTLNVAMTSDVAQLSEVVVVGYTSQKKSALTGAITAVNMADLDKQRVPDVAQLLQGQVVGVQVTQSTGAPGDDISIRIRGEGTIGNNSPLFIIDGIPSREISFLNPSDIQSMTVLKDAAAAAIYGSRASAGVIVITTKSGIKGKANLDISYYNGIQKVANLPTMLNTTQYMNKMEESWNNSGYSGTNPYTADKSRTDLANTDWLHELFVPGKSQNLQLSASGGTDKIQYLISGGYYGQDGIVIYDHDKYQRYNFRTNINANITDRFKVGTNLQLSNTMQDKISSKGDAPGVIRHAFIRPPVIAVFKDINDPTYKEKDPFTDLPFYVNNDQANGGWQSDKYEWSQNPVALAYFTNDKRSNFKTFGNIYAEYAFLKDKELKLRTNLGVDLNMTHNKAFNENFGDDDGGGNATDKGTGRQNRPSNLNEDRGQETTITWNNTLNYSKIIQKHSFSALVGSEFITNYSSSIGASRSRFDYVTAPFQYIDYGGSQVDLWNGGSASEWALFSVFGSINYNYDNRFLVTGSIRGDASSRFAENNQWGYFPSVSAGWRISQEKFMKDVSWISDLKLRASTGSLGNQEIDNYSYLTLLRRSGDQYIISRYGNPDLKWETTKQNNIGLDLGLFKNKIYLSADYFKKTTSDILLPISLPALVGSVEPTIVNAGTVTNKGFELALGFKNNDHAFKYNVDANIATVTNMVEKLHPNLPSIIGRVSKTEVGHPLNSFYGYQMIGIYQNLEEINSYLYGTPNPSNQPGDIKFKDLNEDGIINDYDRTYLGNPNPRLSYGLNLSANFKGFDFSVLFQGVEGVEKYNDLKTIIDYDTRPFNHTVATLNAWNGEGTSNTIPRSTFNDNGSSKVSSIFVEDASYFRLKNIEIGYTLTSLFGKSNTAFQNVRLYVSAQNLFTITKYTGLDPESVDMFDQGTYPQSKAFLFGINIKL
jgi:TonB-linked SusC/RagA family outer membrane protein